MDRITGLGIGKLLAALVFILVVVLLVIAKLTFIPLGLVLLLLAAAILLL